ncbi:MAG: MmgE/PrpD family protein [Chloroflexi bacterium]|nr:MmgE/PrpD family protein [Chloroflexota bacterium]
MSETINRITEFAVKTNFGNLSDTSAYFIKQAVLDLIGCAYTGISTKRGRIAIDVSTKLGGPQESTIIGTSHKVSSANAAFANGELINALDFDAMTDIGKHDVPVVIPAAMAVAESIGASGQDLISAISIGLEISTRLNSGSDRIVVSAQKWPAVMGSSAASIAAAITVGKLLGLDKEKMSNAIGISGYLCPPNTFKKWLETSPVSMIKYGSSGWGAQVGVTSALLAFNGYTGDTELFDGEYGFWRFTGKSEPLSEDTFADLGDKWVWQKVNFKKYPAGGVLSGILNQFIQLIEANNLKAEDIDQITAYGPAIAGFKLFRENELQTPDDYCFNTGYLLACAANRIKRSLWQREETRQDPGIKKFMQTINLNLITGAKIPRPIEVLANRQRYTWKTDYERKQETEKEIGADEILIEKFMDNTSVYLSLKKRKKIIQEILKLEECANFAHLMELVTM